MALTRFHPRMSTAREALGGVLVVTPDATAVSTGTGKFTFRAPKAFRVTELKASLTVAASAGNTTIDLNRNGATMLTTKLRIDAGSSTSVGSSQGYVLDHTDIDADDELTVDVDAAGTGGVGLKLEIIGYQL